LYCRGLDQIGPSLALGPPTALTLSRVPRERPAPTPGPRFQASGVLEPSLPQSRGPAIEGIAPEQEVTSAEYLRYAVLGWICKEE
jgi:hypothetical protein